MVFFNVIVGIVTFISFYLTLQNRANISEIKKRSITANTSTAAEKIERIKTLIQYQEYKIVYILLESLKGLLIDVKANIKRKKDMETMTYAINQVNEMDKDFRKLNKDNRKLKEGMEEGYIDALNNLKEELLSLNHKNKISS